ncbi:ATP synthase protein I [Alkalibacterium subtropicum]|uniref:ATP synthase protein I n=1 Tax=Alkalibacterium subtropicum TaxID=753702 RepID=A0A1I1HS44_9LACT|nr:AtpZ/AtpI family protein [Alkalibacterium subtropicum]SFC24788.1 ATP synthase protein I [Alkalibacterium subtropicum]
MNKKKESTEEELLKSVKSDADKKMKAQDEGSEIMFGLNLFGIVGWSISIPTLLGTALGIYLDRRFTHSFSWTITLLFLGVIIGSLNAWRWIKEKTEMGRKDHND